MVYMIESQVEYILRALQTMKTERTAAIEVRPQVERAYNEQIQQRLGRAIWSTGGCKSWYLDPKTGKNTTLWPGFAFRFRQATSTFSMGDYFAYTPEVQPNSAPHVHAAAVMQSGASAPSSAEAT
jgi:hypothetical protein